MVLPKVYTDLLAKNPKPNDGLLILLDAVKDPKGRAGMIYVSETQA